MSYASDIESALQNPKLLEELYQKARQAGQASAFAGEIARRFAAAPDNVLLAAWHYRLQPAVPAEEPARRINWRLAIPLSLVLSLVYAVLIDKRFDLAENVFPYLVLAWAPLAACMVIAFLTVTRKSVSWRWDGLLALGVVALLAYVTWLVVGPRSGGQYRDLMALHLPLLAWAAVGLSILGRKLDDRHRFAFLIKSAEVVLTGGIFFGAAVVFVGITAGLFDAIGIKFTDDVMRWLLAGAAGLIPVLAVASVYDPHLPPAEQRFDQGLAKLISLLGRIFLPLTLLVLVIYVLYIPANFWRPFEQRDVLIVYNAMLFAVLGLLIIATPFRAEDVPERLRKWLWYGIVAVAALTLLVSLYALSATVYRTVLNFLTMNRLTVIGWNVINIALLGLFLYRQIRYGLARWIESSQVVFRMGMVAYAIWTVLLIVVMSVLLK
jgi:hypothetical protein